jgi:plastocyanin
MKNAYFLVLLILAAFACGCASRTPPAEIIINTSPEAPPEEVVTAPETAGANPGVTTNNSRIVIIRDFSFSPTPMRIRAQDTVTWLSEDVTEHSIKSDFMNTSLIHMGQSVKFRFKTPGIYDYWCGEHSAMKGQIIVE